MFIETGLATVRIGVPMHCLKRFTAALEVASVTASLQHQSVICVEFHGQKDLQLALEIAAEFAVSHSLKVSITGPGRYIYTRLSLTLNDLFGGDVSVHNETDLARAAVNHCIQTKHGMHRVHPIDYFVDPKPEITKMSHEQPSYPFILVDIRLNSKYIRVS